MPADFSTLASTLKQNRTSGVLHLEWTAFEPETAAAEFEKAAGSRANHFLLHLGFKPNAHCEVDRANALTIVTSLLHQDFAYSSELTPFDTAAKNASAFLGFCEKAGPVRYFTNGFIQWEKRPQVFDLQAKPLFSWKPVTRATFDNGIVIVTPSHCGLIWAEDED